MVVTDMMLPTQEATAEANGMGMGIGQQVRAAVKRSRSESSNSQRADTSVSVHGGTRLNNSGWSVDTAGCEAGTRGRNSSGDAGDCARASRRSIYDKRGERHPINPRNGFVSDWPVGHSGCFLCGDDHRFEHCSRQNEQGGKACFHANFGAHRPEHIKRVKLMAKPTDCGKRMVERIDRNI
eukprot:scaffold73240_cov61-Attheya_sp.AAC.2